jgi:hypothetical protein
MLLSAAAFWSACGGRRGDTPFCRCDKDQEGDPGQGREQETAEGAPAWLALVVGVQDGDFALDLDDLVKLLSHLHG